MPRGFIPFMATSPVVSPAGAALPLACQASAGQNPHMGGHSCPEGVVAGVEGEALTQGQNPVLPLAG